jgi:chitinase
MRYRSLTALLLLALSVTHAGITEAQKKRAHRPLLVGYFPQWGVYGTPRYLVKNLVTSGAAGLLDQINYAQGSVVDDRCAIADANADANLIFAAQDSVNGVADDPAKPLNGNFHQLQELKRRYPKLRILISLEGKPERFVSAAKPKHRAAFVASCIDMFIRGNFGGAARAPGIFDGFDIDWEKVRSEDRDDYVALLEEFRRQMKAVHHKPKLILSVAGPAGRDHYAQMDLTAMGRIADQVGVMNYDYNGPWSSTTGLLAPLFAVDGDPVADNTVDTTIQDYLHAGIPARKLLLGIPFYAYEWDQVKAENHGLFQKGKRVSQDQPYRYIRSIQDKFEQFRDEKSRAPWLYDGTSFWTYDDAVSIRRKVEYERSQRLGGVMVWELSGDSDDGLLLKTIAGSESDLRAGGGR